MSITSNYTNSPSHDSFSSGTIINHNDKFYVTSLGHCISVEGSYCNDVTLQLENGEPLSWDLFYHKQSTILDNEQFILFRLTGYHGDSLNFLDLYLSSREALGKLFEGVGFRGGVSKYYVDGKVITTEQSKSHEEIHF